VAISVMEMQAAVWLRLRGGVGKSLNFGRRCVVFYEERFYSEDRSGCGWRERLC
jgi:hypothetical protein